MKKILFVLLLLTGFVGANSNANAQGVVYSVWKSIVADDDIYAVKSILFWSGGFVPVDKEIMILGGHDPDTTLIGTRGDNPNNSILAIVKSMGVYNYKIREAQFVCAKIHAQKLNTDLLGAGYKVVHERRYRDDGGFYYTEKTYDSNVHNFRVTIKFANGDGSGNATFSRKK